jgi:hypothetical protein
VVLLESISAMGSGFLFFLGLLWRWEVVSAGAIAVFFAGGLSAVYGDDFILATCLFFLAVVWVTAKAISWSEVKGHKDRVWVSLFIIILAVVALGGSLKWIQGRAAAEAAKPHPAPEGEKPQSPPVTATQNNPPPSIAKGDPTRGASAPQRKPHSRSTPAPTAPTVTTMVPPAAPLTQNCDNGNCIGGNNYGSATVNNYAPPKRKLTKDEREKFVSSLRPYCPFGVAVRAIPGNADSMEYADQISSAIHDAGCPLLRAKFLIDTAASYGVALAIHDAANVPAGANALLASFKAANIPTTTSVGDPVEPGVVYVLVGLNDSKPQ